MKGARMGRIVAGAALGFWALIILAPAVAANPVPMFDTRFDSWWHGLLAIGIANFGVNLLFISSLLYLIVRINGKGAGAFRPTQWGFLGQILGVNLIITACGAVIDFIVFYRPHLGYYDFEFSIESLIIGSLLVSITAAIACLLVLRLRKRISIAIAVTLGIVNCLAWVLTIQLALESQLLVPITVMFCALFTVPMYLLMNWHSKAFGKSTLDDEGAHSEDQRILRCNFLCLLGIGLAFGAWLMDEALYNWHGTGGDGWFLILMAVTLGLVSPLAGGGFMLFLIVVSDSASIAGAGLQVSALITFIMLLSLAYPLGIGYERRRCTLDRLLTFRTVPAFNRMDDRTKSIAGGSAD